MKPISIPIARFPIGVKFTPVQKIDLTLMQHLQSTLMTIKLSIYLVLTLDRGTYFILQEHIATKDWSDHAGAEGEGKK